MAAGASGWQPAAIEEVRAETPRIKVFVLRPAVWHGFVAGQHLDFRLTAPDGYQAERSYSVDLRARSGRGSTRWRSS